jgi:hypothetical protein
MLFPRPSGPTDPCAASHRYDGDAQISERRVMQQSSQHCYALFEPEKWQQYIRRRHVKSLLS